jgi:hypothetical protein
LEDTKEGSQISAGKTWYSLALRNKKYQNPIKRMVVFNVSNKNKNVLDFFR